MQPRQSFREAHLFSDIALESCGFEIATERIMTREIYRVMPSGKRSALFAAIIESLNNMKSLNLMIQDSGTAQNWRLALVVLVSEHDSASPMDWMQVKRIYSETKQRLKVSRFDIIFVAYNVNRQVYQQLFFLQNLDDFGYTQLHLATNRQLEDGYENIGRLMQRIRDGLGMVRHQKKDEKVLAFNADMNQKINPSLSEDVQRNPYQGYNRNFAVMFTVSTDQRLRGEPWTSLCHGIQTFTKYFGGEDLIGCTLFSEWCQFFCRDKFQRRYPVIYAPINQPIPMNRPIGHNGINAPLLAHHPPRPMPILNQQHVILRNQNQNSCGKGCCCIVFFILVIAFSIIVIL